MMQTLLNGKYQIIKELGEGGFGTTYLAKDTERENFLCAIKRLNPDLADLETAKKLFKREADILSRLQAIPQVPKFINYFEENNNSYIVEEYIQGESLENLLEKKWDSQSIIVLLWDVLSVLQLLHQKNIVHRDIKPSNLIQREQDYKVTIIDFGAVKELTKSQLVYRGTSIHSLGYTPLEQVHGTPSLNSDIYALGMTAIQLLTGIHPRNLIRDELDNALGQTGFNISQSLRDILNKMVKTNYQERYQSVDEVLKAIGTINPQPPQPPESIEQTSFQLNKKLLFTLLFLLAIISSEIFYPWIRPIYYLAKGNRLLDKDRSELALQQFQYVIDLNRDRASGWKGSGDVLFVLGRYLGALEAYQKANQLQPNNLKTMNNIGKTYSKLEAEESALNTHKQVLKIDPNNVDAWSSIGLIYLSRGQYKEALEAFDKAKAIKPDEPTVWLQKGIVLKALQRPQEAQQFYEEAFNVYEGIANKKQKDPVYWSDRGLVLLQLNRLPEASESYDRALKIEPNFYEALLGKANIFSANREHEKALELFKKAATIRPQDYQVWYNQGNLLGQVLQKHEEALACFEKTIELKPNFAPAWLGKGLALSSLNRNREALTAFDKAKDLTPQDPFIWVNRGITLEKLGELEEAQKSYQKAAIDLKFLPAREYLEKLQQKF